MRAEKRIAVLHGIASGCKRQHAGFLAVAPEGEKIFNAIDEVSIVTGLAKIRMSAQTEGVLDVTAICRGAPNDGRNNTVIRVVVDPFKDLETADVGHLQVQDENIRKRTKGAIIKWCVALQIGDGVGTIVHHANRLIEARFLKGALQDEGIVLIVIRNQDTYDRFHGEEYGRVRKLAKG